MKLEYMGGRVGIFAETAEEVKRLMEFLYMKKAEPRVVPVQKAERVYGVSWKGKRRKLCEQCGKKFKNVVMHRLIVHEGLRTGRAAANFAAAHPATETTV